MHIKLAVGVVGVALLLAGCSSTSSDLTAGGQQVRFVEEQPGNECRLLGTATGEQSNWLSGQDGEGGSMRGAANALRNNAAAMGGNVLYGVSTPSQTLLSSFVPTDTQMTGQVYNCPN